MLEEIGAGHIGQRNSGKEKYKPPKSLAFEIEEYEYKKKQVKWHPVVGCTHERHQAIKNGICPIAVDKQEQGLVPLFNPLP